MLFMCLVVSYPVYLFVFLGAVQGEPRIYPLRGRQGGLKKGYPHRGGEGSTNSIIYIFIYIYMYICIYIYIRIYMDVSLLKLVLSHRT